MKVLLNIKTVVAEGLTFEQASELEQKLRDARFAKYFENSNSFIKLDLDNGKYSVYFVDRVMYLDSKRDPSAFVLHLAD